MSTLVIGTDEAGYGPNLGPLVVAASAWRVHAAPDVAEAALGRAAAAVAAAGGPLWDDSKRLFRGGNLAPLERGVLAAARLATGAAPADWRALAAACGIVAAVDAAPEAPARAGLALPRRADAAACAARAERAAELLAAAGVGLVALRCRVIEPAEFNDLLDRGLSKADVLSAATLELAAALAARADGPVLVWCDRHGGRRRYAPLVASAFGAVLVQPLAETAARSAYALGADGGRIEFCVGGEARLPVALASMTAKYVRELAMEAFNAHWCARRPGLGATAGYPVDAARWWREAEGTVRAAGVERRRLWRRS